VRYVRLGSTGLVISEVVLGCLSFGQQVNETMARRVVDRALDIGITAYDTADMYNQGRSEEFLGRALSKRRGDVVIATKVAHRVGDGPAFPPLRSDAIDYAERWKRGISPNSHGLSRVHIVQAVDASLRRLGTDYIDLYQVHEWDPAVGLEETLSALDDLVHAGKVRYVGCSRFAAWQLYRSLWMSQVRNLVRFESVQARYNLLERDAERELVPACQAASVGMLAFRVLAAGMLTGRYSRDREPDAGSRMTIGGARDAYWRADVFAEVDRLKVIASASDRTPTQLAIGWALAQPGVNAAIVGAEQPEDLVDVAIATSRPLAGDELEAISALG